MLLVKEVKVKPIAAVWAAAGTLCSTALFEQLITEGSDPACILKWSSSGHWNIVAQHLSD